VPLGLRILLVLPILDLLMTAASAVHPQVHRHFRVRLSPAWEVVLYFTARQARASVLRVLHLSYR
jgi:hypothetical protein